MPYEMLSMAFPHFMEILCKSPSPHLQQRNMSTDWNLNQREVRCHFCCFVISCKNGKNVLKRSTSMFKSTEFCDFSSFVNNEIIAM